jgi:hypothetical protein
MTYVYVASSWRNQTQPLVIEMMRKSGIGCYDFRNPGTDDHGFHWSDLRGVDLGDARSGPLPKGSDFVPLDRYLDMVDNPVAIDGFRSDFDAMQEADTFALILPCGKSAHLELGWAVGAGKRTAILLEEEMEPELMYRMVDYLAPSIMDLIDWVIDEDKLSLGGLRLRHGTEETA